MSTRSSPSGSARRYAMFISYRHADNLEMGRKWATWLHESMENYEVPEDLVGTQNLRGDPVPATLYPVFRDEEELPADADLSTNIQRALENSGLLVVICSPRAVQSRFVADEIRHFKELGNSGRILALIIDGEPNASDDPENIARLGAAAECFPEPLRFGVPDENGVVDWTRRTEPIAADCRPGGHPAQGWTTPAAYQEALDRSGNLSRTEKSQAVRDYTERLELAKLKVIAGALGVPLGQLTQRDKVRQLRRAKQRARILSSLSVIFAILAGAAGILGWLANEKRTEAETQRREADHQRHQAEEEKRRAIATLAASDFQEGVNRLARPASSRSGLAFLARAARAGNASAAIRIWTLFQQQAFWLPLAATDVPPPAKTRLTSAAAPAAFQQVELNGQPIAPTAYAESADGTRCVTIVSNAEAGEGDITFRFWKTSGEAIGPWQTIAESTGNYLSSITAASFSADGAYAAIIAQPWRAPQFIEIWDVNRAKKIGKTINADGLHPNYQGAAFSDIWFEQQNLVTLSSRGDASIHRVESSDDSSDVWKILTHSHEQPVTRAVLDLEHLRFASASSDRQIQVSDFSSAEPLASPIQSPDAVEALRIDSPDTLTIRHAESAASSWKLQPPSQPRPSPQPELLLTKEANAPEPAAIADQRGTRMLKLENPTTLTITDSAAPDAAPAWQHRFPTEIALARFLDDRSVIVQTSSFTTEIWDAIADVQTRPTIDEAALFNDELRSDTVLPSSLTADGTLLLTRSFFWEPPNMGIFSFTVWDAATGKPLSQPRRIIDDVATDDLAENHAEFSADGNFLLFGRVGAGGKPAPSSAIELRPPAVLLPLIPQLAESLGGLRLRPDSTLETSPDDPAIILENVRAALAE